MNNNERINWVFDCPVHGLEEGLFCPKAYDDNFSNKWFKARYTIYKLKTSSEEKTEWVRIMNLTRRYNGVLPT